MSWRRGRAGTDWTPLRDRWTLSFGRWTSLGPAGLSARPLAGIRRTCWSPASFPAALEFARDAPQMPVHRRACGIGVVRLERRDDRFVIDERLGAQRRCVEMPFDPPPELAAPLVPQIRDGERRARRCRWPWRSARGTRGRWRRARRNRRRARACAAIVWRRAAMSALRALRAASAAISPSISVRAVRRSNGPGPVVAAMPTPAGRASPDPGARDEDARADAHFDPAGELERDDGLAHRSPRHAEQHGELALRRQPRTRGKLAVVDQRRRSARRSAGTAGVDSTVCSGTWLPSRPGGCAGPRRTGRRWRAVRRDGLYCGVAGAFGQVVQPPGPSRRRAVLPGPRACDGPWRQSRLEMPGLAARLLEQAHALDPHPAVDGLAHVVDGQQADGGRGERLHLDAGLAERFGRHLDRDGARGACRIERHGDPGQRQRVAQRDEIARCAWRPGSRRCARRPARRPCWPSRRESARASPGASRSGRRRARRAW